MSYRVNAYRGKNIIKIPIEEKHIYDRVPYIEGSSLNNVGTYHIKQYGGNSSNITTDGRGFRPTSYNIIPLWCSDELALSKGDGVDNFIGDKISLARILIKMNFIVNPSCCENSAAYPVDTNTQPTMYPAWEEPPDVISPGYFDVERNVSWRRNYRLLLVHFEEDQRKEPGELYVNGLKIHMAQWWNEIHVGDGVNTNGETTTCSVNNKILRETTKWNGNYNILRNIPFTLTANNTNHEVLIDLEIKRELDLIKSTTESGQTIYSSTNDWFNNTYLFLITPSFYKLDMDPLSYACYNALATTSNLQEVDYTFMVKYTYYDL